MTTEELDEERDQKAPTELCTCECGSVGAVAGGAVRTVAPHDPAHVEFGPLRLFPGSEEWITTQLVNALPLPPSSTSRAAARPADESLNQSSRRTSDRMVGGLALTGERSALTQRLNRRAQAYMAVLSKDVSAPEMVVFASVSTGVMANCASLAQSNLRASPGSVHLEYGGRHEEEQRQARCWPERWCVRESYRVPVGGPGGDS